MNRLLPTALLLLLLTAFRIIGSAFPETLPNFQPLAALFFCGALLAKDWRAWAIPLGAWALTYPAPALISGNPTYLTLGVILVTAFAFSATFLIGKKLSGTGMATLLGGSVAAALAFHLITNGAAWMASPLYPKTPTGLWQSLWAGPAGSPIPSWVFLRNMTCANLLFTAIFLSARFALPQARISATQPASAR
ncbi:hypothetical protein HZ994_12060 [Akkermansiaceae bacterium]|nr:hypothetical protein HZ994_12060 [Akkermansiaceae bacterium]